MRFSIRSLLIAFVALSGLCYGVAIVRGEFRKANEAAVRSDYMDGSITHDQARAKVGDVVDAW